MMTILAFGGMGLTVLTRQAPFNKDSGRAEVLLDWVDTLIVSHGPEVVGYGLIGFGFVFGFLWMAIGHNR